MSNDSVEQEICRFELCIIGLSQIGHACRHPSTLFHALKTVHSSFVAADARAQAQLYMSYLTCLQLVVVEDLLKKICSHPENSRTMRLTYGAMHAMPNAQ